MKQYTDKELDDIVNLNWYEFNKVLMSIEGFTIPQIRYMIESELKRKRRRSTVVKLYGMLSVAEVAELRKKIDIEKKTVLEELLDEENNS